MGTFQSFRKAYGALKDSTTVGLAKVNSEFKDLDIAVVKATNHVEAPPKERHVRKVFAATSVVRPRADVAYCIHALARRLNKTKNWIVAIKVLIVIHRTLREGDPTFREELLAYSHRGHILQISNFKDDSSPLAWDCSAWVRTYALFLEERLECFRVLKYDIEAERLTRSSPGASKVHSRTRLLTAEELLEQLPALQQLLFRLMGCQPEGTACTNYLIQYALALVLKESFKIYCAINDGIINLVDMFFDMTKHDAVKALNIYKRAGQQAEFLADFYEFSKRLDLARNFQFPTLRQPPPSFLATMEEYVKEAPHSGSVAQRLGLQEINPKAAELEEMNALALAIIQPGGENRSSASNALTEFSGTSGWELALVTTPSNINSTPPTDTKLAGGFDSLLLNSLYEDENARRQLQMQNAGYGPYGMGAGATQVHNPYEQQQDPFFMSNNFAPPTNVQMAMSQQHQQQIMMQQQHHHQQLPPSQSMMMVPYQSTSPTQYPQQQSMAMGASNPFGDPFSAFPQTATPIHGNHGLL
uniref:ENTH domain-containing protein n=1 Tax=Chenopodium quinoa TaxID=63459 RepID=A0A803MPR1_CHEQI